MRNADNEEVLSVALSVLSDIVNHEGDVPGASREECGNYRELQLESAKLECDRYLTCLHNFAKIDFSYKA